MSMQHRWIKEVLAASADGAPTLPWQRGNRALLRSMERSATMVTPQAPEGELTA